MTEIICAGFGGQGILTMGLILARVGMRQGLHVTWIPSYGSEMRGGTANCHVKISAEPISSPFVKQIDILVAMNEPSLVKFEPFVKSGAVALANASIVKDYPFRQDIEVFQVEANDLAAQVDHPKGANIVMLGALTAATQLFERQVMAEGIDEFFASKGKQIPKNRLCFDLGYEAVKKLIPAILEHK